MKDPKLVKVEQEVGVTFPAGSRLLGEGDGGSRGGEYYEWFVASPANVVIPPSFGNQLEGKDKSSVESAVDLIDHRLDVAYRVPSKDRLSGDPSTVFRASRDVPPYEYQVKKLVLDTGECYVLIMRHKR